jgi:hypothetical protein
MYLLISVHLKMNYNSPAIAREEEDIRSNSAISLQDNICLILNE